MIDQEMNSIYAKAKVAGTPLARCMPGFLYICMVKCGNDWVMLFMIRVVGALMLYASIRYFIMPFFFFKKPPTTMLKPGKIRSEKHQDYGR